MYNKPVKVISTTETFQQKFMKSVVNPGDDAEFLKLILKVILIFQSLCLIGKKIKTLREHTLSM